MITSLMCFLIFKSESKYGCKVKKKSLIKGLENLNLGSLIHSCAA